MIRTLLVGCARCLFNLACLALLVGGLLVYASYRLARAAVKEDRGQPARVAGFQVLLAVVGLAKVLAASRPGDLVPTTMEADDADAN